MDAIFFDAMNINRYNIKGEDIKGDLAWSKDYLDLFQDVEKNLNYIIEKQEEIITTVYRWDKNGKEKVYALNKNHILEFIAKGRINRMEIDYRLNQIYLVPEELICKINCLGVAKELDTNQLEALVKQCEPMINKEGEQQ